MSVVHTAFGPGRIVGEDTVRGRKQFLVEGAAFKTWIDEADAQIDYRTSAFGDAPTSLGDHADTNDDSLEIHDDNSVALPYNPEPQFPVEQFHGEQNIQPNHLLDAEDRTSDANSITFKDAPGRTYPGPSKDNFAKSSALGDIDEYVHQHHTPYHEDKPSESAGSRPHHIELPSVHDDEELVYPSGIGEEFEHDVEHGGTMRNKWRHYHDPMDMRREKNRGPKRPGSENTTRSNLYAASVHEVELALPPGQATWGPTTNYHAPPGGSNRLAGLSDKYIDITADADHFNDPVQRFRDDPAREINRVGHILQVNFDPRIAEYAQLVDSDPQVRVAAWADVRSKAMRLRHEGKVDVHDFGPNRIYATVEGDNGSYDVMLVTGGFSGFGGGHGIDSWSCSCDWGAHAFNRTTHVGRLCSHGLACLHEMQSREMKDVAKKQPSGRPYQKKKSAQGDWKHNPLIPHGHDWSEEEQRWVPDPDAEPLAEGQRDPRRPKRDIWDALEEHHGPTHQAGVTEDFKKWSDDENQGHVDIGGLTNFISLPQSKDSKDPRTKKEPFTEEEVTSLYDYEKKNESGAPARNYDPDSYTFDHDKAYKKNADVLRLRPHSLTPDFRFIEGEGDGEEWTDVEKDDRKTTGPEQIQHFGGRHEQHNWLGQDEMHAHSHNDPDWERSPTGGPHYRTDNSTGHGEWHESRVIAAAIQAIRYAADESDRDGSGIVEPDKYRDFDGGGKLLDKLRTKIDKSPGESLQHMETRNDDIRDIVDELHEKGYGAENLVASVHQAAGAAFGFHPYGFDEDKDAFRDPYGLNGPPESPGFQKWLVDNNALGHHKDPNVYNAYANEQWEWEKEKARKEDMKKFPGRSSSFHQADGSFLGQGGGGWADETFCVDGQTEILTDNGWKHYQDVEVGNSALTLNHKTGLSEWQPIQQVNVFDGPREMLSIESRSHSSLTTLNHRWPVIREGYIAQNSRGWTTSGTYGSHDYVPIVAECADLPTEAKYTDALVEAVAWFWTEGDIRPLRDGSQSRSVNITQSITVNADKCEMIASALTRLFGSESEFTRRGGMTFNSESGKRNVYRKGQGKYYAQVMRGGQKYHGGTFTTLEEADVAAKELHDRLFPHSDDVPRWYRVVVGQSNKFRLNAEAGEILQGLAPNRVPTHEFLLSLTKAQLDLFIKTSMLGDGHSRDNAGEQTLGQKDLDAAEAFQFACILAGLPTSIHTSPVMPEYGYGMTNVRIRKQRRFRLIRGHHEQTTTSMVWCPTTPNGTWLARRNGKVYFTGNSGSGPDPKLWIGDSEDYVDEHERSHHQDLTNADGDIVKYTIDDEKPKQGPGKRAKAVRRQSAGDERRHHEDPRDRDYDPHEERSLFLPSPHGDNGRFDMAIENMDRHGSIDPIDHFYKSGAADALKGGSSSGGGGFSDDAIAGQARGFLRTAGRNFSLAEQRALEDEMHVLGARNLPTDDELAGTHYVD